MKLYIASQDAEGGILRCELTQEGQLQLIEKTSIPKPAFLAMAENKIFALLREPFMFQSGVAEFDILSDGSLKQNGPAQPAFGTISAHIIRHRGHTYVAHYCSSTAVRLPDIVMPYSGSSVNPVRQPNSHPHCITPTPDGDFLCVCDLGTDSIYVSDLELKEVSRVTTVPGAGPRHLVFSPDGKFAYGSNEMGNTVSVYSYSYGKLTRLADYPTVPEDFDGVSTASAIRITPDGKRLYVSNRGHDSVAEYYVNGQELTLSRFISSHGQSPREMNLAGRFLLCGNEISHTVTVFDLEGDVSQPTCVFPAVRPWCILPTENP